MLITQRYFKKKMHSESVLSQKAVFKIINQNKPKQ